MASFNISTASRPSTFFGIIELTKLQNSKLFIKLLSVKRTPMLIWFDYT